MTLSLKEQSVERGDTDSTVDKLANTTLTSGSRWTKGGCGCHMSLKWHYETGTPPLSAVCFPKVHNPGLSMSNHQADPNREAFYKYMPRTPHQYPGHEHS